MTPEKKRRLLQYAKKVLGVETDAEVIKFMALKGSLQSAQEGLEGTHIEGLESTGGMSDNLSYGLEAIIHLQLRPVIDVVNDDFSKPEDPFAYLQTDSVSHENLCKALPSVGRIEVPNIPQLPYAGTGFVVGEELLMTNRHVAELVCQGLGKQGLTFRPGQSADVNFKRELGLDNITHTTSFKIAEIIMIHPYWDMALFRTIGLGEINQLTLSTAPIKSLENQDIVAIGFPALDPRNDIEQQTRIFRNNYNIKRLQPGKITGTANVESFNKMVDALAHDASTLGGDSGAAVVDPKTGLVVGLHFGGTYLVSNYAVPLAVLAQDSQVAGIGIRFESTVNPVIGPWDDYWKNTGGAPEAPAVNLVRQPPSTPPPVQIQSTEWNFTVPLEISLRLGTQGSATSATTPSVSVRDRRGGTKNIEIAAALEGTPPFAGAASPAMPVDASVTQVGDPGWLARSGFDLDLAVFLAQASQAAYGNAAMTQTWATSQGFETARSIDRDNVQGFWCAKGDSALLVFRGTSNPAQWLRDARFFPVSHPWGTVHVGFRDGVNNVEPDLAEFDEVAKKAKNLWISGHSLGGALAVLAGARFKTKGMAPSIYTYGQPRVGFGNFADRFGMELPGRLTRFVNQSDIVTRVPPGPFYTHCGIVKRIVRPDVLESLALTAQPRIVDHDAPQFTEAEFTHLQDSLEKASVSPALESFDLGGFFPFIHDHFIGEYIRLLSDLKKTLPAPAID